MIKFNLHLYHNYFHIYFVSDHIAFVNEHILALYNIRNYRHSYLSHHILIYPDFVLYSWQRWHMNVEGWLPAELEDRGVS